MLIKYDKETNSDRLCSDDQTSIRRNSKYYQDEVKFLQKHKKEKLDDYNGCSHDITTFSFSIPFNNRSKPWYTTFFRFLPCIRFYPNVMRAIRELEYFDDTISDTKGKQYKAGLIKRNELGYKELVSILQQMGTLRGEPDAIALFDQYANSGLFKGKTSLTATRIRSIIALVNGKTMTIQTEQFGPMRITRELRDMAESILRRHLAYWMLIIIGIWLALNMYLRFFIYIN